MANGKICFILAVSGMMLAAPATVPAQVDDIENMENSGSSGVSVRDITKALEEAEKKAGSSAGGMSDADIKNAYGILSTNPDCSSANCTVDTGGVFGENTRLTAAVNGETLELQIVDAETGEVKKTVSRPVSEGGANLDEKSVSDIARELSLETAEEDGSKKHQTGEAGPGRSKKTKPQEEQLQEEPVVEVINDDAEYDAHYKAGIKMMSAKKFTEAADEFQTALSHKDDPEARAELKQAIAAKKSGRIPAKPR